VCGNAGRSQVTVAETGITNLTVVLVLFPGHLDCARERENIKQSRLSVAPPGGRGRSFPPMGVRPKIM